MTSIRIAFATLAVAAAGIAHADEIGDVKMAASSKTRAEVQADARTAPKFDDYRHVEAEKAATSMAPRAGTPAASRVIAANPLFVGGM